MRNDIKPEFDRGIGDIPQFLQNALSTSLTTGNILLAGYCQDFSEIAGIDLSVDLPTELAVTGEKRLAWLDVEPQASVAHGGDPLATLEYKIKRTVKQISAVEKGTQPVVYVAVPAMNEEMTLPLLMHSLKHQTTASPISVVVADNNSTDRSREVAQSYGANVVLAKKQGVGSARQVALDYILADITNPLNALIIQTDADCELVPDYISVATENFINNPAMSVGIGPSYYSVRHENGTVYEIRSGKDYANLLGTTGLRGYFELAGEDPADYLIEPPYRYLVGPNTVFRASMFTDHSIRYPTDGRWETLDLSVQIQSRLPSSQAIQYFMGLGVHVSSRAILGDEPYLTDERLEHIRTQKFVGMYKKDGTNQTPYESILKIISELNESRTEAS